MYSYYISYIFIYILHYSCCSSCAIFASKPQYSKFYKYQIINFLIHTHIFFCNLHHIIFHTIISILYSVNNLRTRESHLKKSFSNLFLSSTKDLPRLDEKESWNLSRSLLIQNIDPHLTNVQVSIHDYCWAQTPGAIVTRGRVVTVWRSIGVLEKRPSKARFTTSWNVPPAGSASYTTSLCEYLHLCTNFSIFAIIYVSLHPCVCVMLLFYFVFFFFSLHRWICTTRIRCTVKFSI